MLTAHFCLLIGGSKSLACPTFLPLINYGCHLSGWAGLGIKNPQFSWSKMAMKRPHLKGGGFHVSMLLFLIFAFFSALVFLLSLCSLTTFSSLELAHPMRCLCLTMLKECVCAFPVPPYFRCCRALKSQ